MSDSNPGPRWIDDSSGPGLLADFSDAQWQRFLDHTESRTFAAGERLIEQDEIDRTLYLVRSGRLEVRTRDAVTGQETPIAEIPAGSVVGEQAFIDGQPRSASIVALEDGELLCLTPKRFRQLKEQDPAIAAAFLQDVARALSERLRRLMTAPH